MQASDLSLSRLEGVKLVDKQIENTIHINFDILHIIAVKLKVGGSHTMTKKPLCAAFVDLHARRELEKLTGVTPVNDEEGANINRDVPRLLNVIFSDTFVNLFARHGQAVDKEELDNGTEVDQLLFIDALAAYNGSTSGNSQ